jgi:hypothetical protein
MRNVGFWGGDFGDNRLLVGSDFSRDTFELAYGFSFYFVTYENGEQMQQRKRVVSNTILITVQ